MQCSVEVLPPTSPPRAGKGFGSRAECFGRGRFGAQIDPNPGSYCILPFCVPLDKGLALSELPLPRGQDRDEQSEDLKEVEVRVQGNGALGPDLTQSGG